MTETVLLKDARAVERLALQGFEVLEVHETPSGMLAVTFR